MFQTFWLIVTTEEKKRKLFLRHFGWSTRWLKCQHLWGDVSDPTFCILSIRVTHRRTSPCCRENEMVQQGKRASFHKKQKRGRKQLCKWVFRETMGPGRKEERKWVMIQLAGRTAHSGRCLALGPGLSSPVVFLPIASHIRTDISSRKASSSPVNVGA